MERLEQEVRDPPLKRQRPVRQVLGPADQHHRQVEQLDVRPDRGAQSLQVVVIAAGRDQGDVEVVATQAFDRTFGGLGVGRGGGAAERGHHLDLVAARGSDQQDPDPVDRRHARHLRRRQHAELAQHRLAPAPFGLHRGEPRQRPDAGEQLAVLDRQHEHVVGGERQRMRGHGRRLVGGGDHRRQTAAAGISLNLGQQRHAALDPGIDQNEIDQPVRQRADGLAMTVAVVQLTAPTAQPRADQIERLAGPLHDDETSG
jgi:hypothetical protein